MSIFLIGEPMGLFMAKSEGKLSEVSDFSLSVAGAEYNVALGLSRLGHEVLYCTRLGDDPIGERICENLEENGILTALISRIKGEQTGIMLKGFSPGKDPEIAYYRRNSAASRFSAHDIDRMDLYGVERVHITGVFPALSEGNLSAVRRLILRAENLLIPVSFDPNIRPDLWKDEKSMVATLNALSEGAETVLPGIKEGRMLTRRETPQEIAAFYHARGTKNVAIKLGEQGAYYSQRDGETGYIPAFPVKRVEDTVGAGDGFAAGVLSALSEGLSLKEAVFRGTVIGAVQVTNRGDNEGLPTREELERVISRGTA